MVVRCTKGYPGSLASQPLACGRRGWLMRLYKGVSYIANSPPSVLHFSAFIYNRYCFADLYCCNYVCAYRNSIRLVLVHLQRLVKLMNSKQVLEGMKLHVLFSSNCICITEIPFSFRVWCVKNFA